MKKLWYDQKAIVKIAVFVIIGSMFCCVGTLVFGACLPDVELEPTSASTEAAMVVEDDTPAQPATATEMPTRIPTNTPVATRTPAPTSTPTPTLEPAYATQTQVAIVREATRVFNQTIDDIRKDCKPIDWVELSEVEYAKDHEYECVYIRGTVSNVNFDEQLLDVYIGWYSARIAVGLDLLNNTPGRITDDMWVNVYGIVRTDRWIVTNSFSGDQTATVGIEAYLIEGPNALLWVYE